jgi:hypothetical protein
LLEVSSFDFEGRPRRCRVICEIPSTYASARPAFAIESLESDGMLRGYSDVTSGDENATPVWPGSITVPSSAVPAVCGSDALPEN